jgi:glyoxylase-like metal-dependent hydrolase (beta-lactamase superfamily II)
VQRAELDALPGGVGSAVWKNVVHPLMGTEQLKVLDGRTRLRGGGRPRCRLAAIPTPGHTVGHQSVLLSSGDERLWFTGDLLVHAVQLVRADVGYRFEADQLLAARTRRHVLRRAARTRATLATAHLTTPFVMARTPTSPQ